MVVDDGSGSGGEDEEGSGGGSEGHRVGDGGDDGRNEARAAAAAWRKEVAEARSKRERGLGTKERRAAVAVGSGFGRGRWAACRLVGWLEGVRQQERVKGAAELGVEIRRRRVIRVRQSLRLKYDTKPNFSGR